MNARDKDRLLSFLMMEMTAKATKVTNGASCSGALAALLVMDHGSVSTVLTNDNLPDEQGTKTLGCLELDLPQPGDDTMQDVCQAEHFDRFHIEKHV